MSASYLISDAIEALELAPSDSNPLSRIDLERIFALIGPSPSEQDSENCFTYLLTRKVLGQRFHIKHLVRWYDKHFSLVERRDSRILKAPPIRTSRTSATKNSSRRIPRNTSSNPVNNVCKDLTDYIEALSTNQPGPLEDLNKLVYDCILQFERHPKARAGLQKAYDNIGKAHTSQHARIGEQSAKESQKRVVESRIKRHREQESDPLLRSQQNRPALYFLLCPSTVQPQASSLVAAQQRHLKEVLSNPVLCYFFLDSSSLRITWLSHSSSLFSLSTRPKRSFSL